nr:MAG TPA: protein of unknown function (DUF4516) [Caudoviricetes sp.]
MFLHVFVTFLLFLCFFVRLCVCALCLPCGMRWHRAWCMVLVCMSCITSSSCVHRYVDHVDH